jgi:hypothetical protein
MTYLLHGADIIWKANCPSACQKNILSSWKPKVHHHVHKSPPLDPILSESNPVRRIDSYLPKVHLNVILPTMPRSSQRSLTFGSPNKNPVKTSSSPMRATCPTYLILDLIALTTFGEEYTSGCGWKEGLQIRRIAVSILNKQSRTADKGWSLSLGFGCGTKNPSP